MSCWTKEQLENMLEDVVNVLDLSEGMIEKHGPLGTAPSELVRLVLEQKDLEIHMLKNGFKPIGDDSEKQIASLTSRLSDSQAQVGVMVDTLLHYGEHEEDCVCYGDENADGEPVHHAADCADCDCGLRQSLALSPDECGSVVREMGEALNKAEEWATKYPLKGEPSTADMDASDVVRFACKSALTLARAKGVIG